MILELNLAKLTTLLERSGELIEKILYWNIELVKKARVFVKLNIFGGNEVAYRRNPRIELFSLFIIAHHYLFDSLEIPFRSCFILEIEVYFGTKLQK